MVSHTFGRKSLNNFLITIEKRMIIVMKKSAYIVVKIDDGIIIFTYDKLDCVILSSNTVNPRRLVGYIKRKINNITWNCMNYITSIGFKIQCSICQVKETTVWSHSRWTDKPFRRIKAFKSIEIRQ